MTRRPRYAALMIAIGGVIAIDGGVIAIDGGVIAIDGGVIAIDVDGVSLSAAAERHGWPP